MRRYTVGAALAAFLLTAVPATFAAYPTPQKGVGSSTIVIVFKDGHRQSFNLADVDRVEFAGSAQAGGEAPPANPLAPPRGHYVGRWEVGDGNGNNFIITLKEGGDADRSLGNVHGHWAYVNGEARVTWDDGPLDAIRKVGSHYQKFAYNQGKKFTDEPDNVTNARLTTERPI